MTGTENIAPVAVGMRDGATAAVATEDNVVTTPGAGDGSSAWVGVEHGAAATARTEGGAARVTGTWRYYCNGDGGSTSVGIWIGDRVAVAPGAVASRLDPSKGEEQGQCQRPCTR